MTEETGMSAIELATEVTVAWLANPNNRVAAEDVPAFLRTIHATLNALATDGSGSGEAGSDDAAAGEFTPAVTARKSLASKDHIISMIDGKPYKMLKRHLSTHGLTPEEYRQRYDLKVDYPMVAENYAAMRRELAKKIGLGRKGRGGGAAAADAASAPKAQRQPRAKKA
jgi:predicted transcriptional regulator